MPQLCLHHLTTMLSDLSVIEQDGEFFLDNFYYSCFKDKSSFRMRAIPSGMKTDSYTRWFS